MVKKVLVIADTHLYTGADFNQKKKEANLPLGERGFLRFSPLLYKDQDALSSYYFQKMVSVISHSEDEFSYLVDLGDSTFGSYNQGLITLASQEERIEYNRLLKERFKEKVDKRVFVHGNHDLGFQNKISKFFNFGEYQKGISKKSFEKAKELIGPPWQFFKVGRFNFLVLNSEVIRAVEVLESIRFSEREFFISEKKKQNHYIVRKLKDSKGPVVLLVHDPLQLKYVWDILSYFKERICLTLGGHFHNVYYGKIIRLFFPVFQEINLRLVPSPWPWGGVIFRKIVNRGGGFVTLELSDFRKSFNLKYHWLEL